MRPWQWIRVLADLTALGWVARPINAVDRAVKRLRTQGSRAVGAGLRLIGIRREPGEGDDGSPS